MTSTLHSLLSMTTYDSSICISHKWTNGHLNVLISSLWRVLTLSQSWLSQCGAQSLSPQGWMASGLFSAEHWFSGTTRPSGALQYTWRSIFPWPHEPEHCNKQGSEVTMIHDEDSAILLPSLLSAAVMSLTTGSHELTHILLKKKLLVTLRVESWERWLLDLQIWFFYWLHCFTIFVEKNNHNFSQFFHDS